MSTGLAVKKESKGIIQKVTDNINSLVNNSELVLPEGYSAGNALKEAFLVLQKTVNRAKQPVLTTCTQASIAEALLNTVVMGLSPARGHAYYIAHGKNLTLMRSYLGNSMLAKRLNPQIDDIHSAVVREGEEFFFDIINGNPDNITHKVDFTTMDNKIVGAYAVAVDGDGNVVKSTVMTMASIHKSWKQSQQKVFNPDGEVNPGTVHEKFEEEMSKRTVLNKLCKGLISTSKNQTYVARAIENNDLNTTKAEMDFELLTKANTEALPEIPEIPLPTDEEIAAETADPFEEL